MGKIQIQVYWLIILFKHPISYLEHILYLIAETFTHQLYKNHTQYAMYIYTLFYKIKQFKIYIKTDKNRGLVIKYRTL